MPMHVLGSRVNIISELGVDKCFKTMPKETKNKLFLGMELELQLKKGSTSEAIAALEPDLKGKVILKEEACCGAGFEIVTIPATLSYHREKLWGDFFEKGAENMRSANGCGIHIHFSRDATNVKQLAKMLYFVHALENVKFLDAIADRQHNAKRPKVYAEGLEATIVDEATKDGRTSLSVSGRFGGKTCEFRIFRSQHTRQGVMQALEFTVALLEYCNIAPDKAEALTATAFIDWFVSGQKKKEYDYLNKNLIRLKYVKRNATVDEMFGAKSA